MPFGTKTEPSASRGPAESFSERIGHYPLFTGWFPGFGNIGTARQVWQNQQYALPTPGASSYAYISQGLPLLMPLGPGIGYGSPPSPVGPQAMVDFQPVAQPTFLRPGNVGHMPLSARPTGPGDYTP